VSPHALPTRLDGPLLLAPEVFGDERGFFCETFRAEDFAALGVTEAFVQDNHSRSRRGTVRGLHFQVGDGASKLVRCGRGTIVDVIVDLRRGSPHYGEWEAHELSDETMHVLYVPVGFAHGFAVISDEADVLYKQSRPYVPELERGIALDDPDIGVRWPQTGVPRIVSQRDVDAPRLAEVEDDLPFRMPS